MMLIFTKYVTELASSKRSSTGSTATFMHRAYRTDAPDKRPALSGSSATSMLQGRSLGHQRRSRR